MSYSGFTQMLCANGHCFSVDSYDETPSHCPTCDAAWAWSNPVDQTNGSYDKKAGVKINGYILLEVKDTDSKCRCCGQRMNQETYWLPLEQGRMLPGHPYYEEEEEE